jgi:quercetin dioxygenase-like cupin family protein
MCGKIVNIDEYATKQPAKSEYNERGGYRERICGEDDEFDLMVGGFSIQPPGHGGPGALHYSMRDKILIVLAGSGTRYIEGEKFPMKPGDIFLTAAKDKHWLQAGPDGLRYFEFSAPKANEGHINIAE